MGSSCGPASGVKVRPAASVLLARAAEAGAAPELFMLRRSAKSAFLPEVFVFPGGAVDEVDAEIARTRLLREAEAPNPQREPSDPAFEAAALREAFEEAGILLAATAEGTPAGLDAERLRGGRAALHAGTTTFAELLAALNVLLDARRLWHFSHWITPPTESRRFDTHFYLALAPSGQAASSDEIETHAGLWISPAEALRRHGEGSFPLIFPTIAHLRRLAPYATLDALREFATTKPIRTVEPEPIVGEQRHFTLPEGLADQW